MEALRKSSGKSRRAASRRRSRALSGLNYSSIISDDDIILPDDALVRKILSKNATVEKNLVAGLANLTRSGAFKEMLRAELQALSRAPERAYNGARAAGNATKAAWSYEKTAKLNGASSALAQQQKETVARAVFRVLAVPRDLGKCGGRRREERSFFQFSFFLRARAFGGSGNPRFVRSRASKHTVSCPYQLDSLEASEFPLPKWRACDRFVPERPRPRRKNRGT